MLEGYNSLLSLVDAPISSLCELIANLIQVYGERRRSFSLVFILDQFEELFTRFVDLGSLGAEKQEGLPDWRLRYEFFDELEQLYFHRGDLERPLGDDVDQKIPNQDTLLPIRYLISMRSEYIAQLDRIRQFVPDLDVTSYRLVLLSPEAAHSAIEKPATEYGFSYSQECYQQIIRDLMKEERYVEPAHLQIVCEKLWNEEGRQLASAARVGADGPEAFKIPLDTYRDKLQSAKGIMRSFVRDFLDQLSREDRLETLEMLEPLITGSGTRNIVEQGQLLYAPFRDTQRRAQLLASLVNGTIVRVEPRLGGRFVEITHEFLIPPVQEALHQEFYSDIWYSQFRVALHSGAVARSNAEKLD